MTLTAVIALIVFLVCIAALVVLWAGGIAGRTASHGRRAAHVAGRRSRG
jgi:hypothetical protein